MPIKINGTNTLASPSITGDDTDTGIVYGSDQIDFSIGGASKVKIDSNGDIGINTTTINRRDAGRNTIQFDYSGSDASEGVELRLSNSALNGNAATDNLQITYTGQNFAINNTENGNIQIFNNGSERLRIDSSGRVGIGTTSPDDRLVLSGSTGDGLKLIDGTHIVVFRTVSGGGILKTASNHALIFGTNDTERMRIDSSGNVGIGTTTISNQKLKVNGNVVIDNGTLRCSDGFSSDTDLILNADANNDGGNSIIFQENGVERMRIDTSGNVGIGTSSITANTNYNTLQIQGQSGSGGAILRLQTTDGSTMKAMIIGDTAGLELRTETDDPISFSTNNSFRRGIASNGQGSHNYTTDCNPKEIYEWSNNKTGMSFRSANTERGNIYFFDSGVQFNTSSDYRLKENVTTISDGITRIKQLIPRKFNWIIDETNTPVDGFLAHEVSSIVPEAINGTKDAVATQEDVDSGLSQKVGDPIHQMIDHSKLVPLLTAALQEAIGRIEVLEAK